MQEQSLFIEALEKEDPAERAAFLDRACAGDPALRQRLERLLQRHQQADSFLEPASVPSASTVAEPLSEGPGTVLGPYKLLEQIGEGGFGIVFMAEQTQPIRRKVALKVLKPGMDSRQVIARFEAERQALALMDHANIAKVFDAGQTSSGRPYFIMDLVKGLPITECCDQAQLTPRERLELFVHVCQAVQHAHQKGIIHRDLKPSNVLVTLQDGTPLVKVIDFGIAKALGQQLTDKTLYTGFAQLIGTPLYMSPEQAALSNHDVDTRSDIYSLGVLLYELLTGTTPFDKERLQQVGYDELRRIIREEEPPRPSTRISTLGQAATTISSQRKSDPRKLSELFRGELDWIVMSALEKDRSRRYQHASAFAADVQHYLADEPVLACPPSAGYRLRKFSRRNKARLAMAACVALTVLVCLLAGAGLWYQRHRRLEASASRVQESSRDARTLVAGNRLHLARRVLAGAITEIGNDREALGSLADDVAALDSEVARLEKFLVLIDQAFQAEVPHAAAEALRSKSTSSNEPAAQVRDHYARVPSRAAPLLLEALSLYGVLEQEDWNSAVGGGLLETEQAQQIREAVYEALLRLADHLVVRHIDYQTGRRLSAESAGRLGLVYLHKAESARPATPAFFRARSACSRLLKDENGARADERRAGQAPALLALDHYLLGLRALNAGDKNEAVKQFEAALRREPTHYWSLLFLGVSLGDLGREQDWAEAARVFTGGIMKRPDYSAAHDLRGRAYQKLHRYEQALADFSKAIDLNPNAASTLTSRGNVLRALGRLDEALADHAKAVRLEPDYAEAHVNLGNVLSLTDRLDQAIAEYERAIRLKPDLFQAHAGLGDAFWEKHRPDQAITEYETAIRLQPNEAELHHRMGIVWCDGKREYDKAIGEFKEAIRLDPGNAVAHFNLGQAFRAKGWIDGAIGDYQKAVRLKPDYSLAHNNLGLALKLKGQPEKAIAAFEEAIRRNPKYADPHFNLGIALRNKGLVDRAIAEFEMTIRLKADYPGAHLNLGRGLRSQRKFPQAVAALTEATRLQPEEADGHNDLGATLFDQGKFQQAEVAFREAVRLRPDRSLYHSSLGNALAGLGRFEEADAEYREGLRLGPNDANAHNAASWFHATCPDAKFRDPQRAVELARQAVALAPKEGSYWNTLGVAHYRAGDYKASLTSLQQSMELNAGGDSGDWFILAMVHWRLGEKGTARQWYSRAVQWMDKNDPTNDELRRFRAEAAALLGVGEKN
jgi:tetratricopeptide (TPR) repeat protein/serine/threonine protein kinase